VAAVIALFVVVILVSPALRLEMRLLWESFREFVFQLKSKL
jgi:hypothetical protein